MDKSIEFTCWKEDDSIEVQLEPEASVFVVQPGNLIKFDPIKPSDDFKWVLRVSHTDKSIQLYPDGSNEGVRIYENNTLIEELIY
ncbi:hypothetical protein [Sabulibacter ruber]|uniref:hypothetical protein n=1 Tax=Sabulibacter ruber TaxID=2811901 RepID=UPI001A95D35F|nr:hypothetical protein [Sabulibacter ruber]